MKSSSIVYQYGLNNGTVSVITFDKDNFDLSLEGYQGEKELAYLTRDELLELGEWFTALGKGRE